MCVVTYETSTYYIFPAMRIFLLFISLRVISYQTTMTKEQEYLGHNLPLVIPDVVILFVTPAICNNYCLHKGECTQPESCTCPPGYSGKRCEICKYARKEEKISLC